MKPVYIDIGAQIGTDTDKALEEGYEVHAFEPNPKHRDFLKPYEDRAKINYAAAWSCNGKIDFYTNEDSPERDVSSCVVPENTNAKTYFGKVLCIDIGQYLKDLNKDIDVLKIDAEGAEYVIIESILDKFDPKRIKEWRIEDHSGYIKDKSWFEHRDKITEQAKNFGIIINRK